jgi:hypothetical protein
MANNVIQVKRTSTAGRTPNTTNSSNTQYIAAGEFALNMPDQILYTSNGSTLITVGANQVNLTISGIISANGSIGAAPGQVLTTDGASKVYWSTVSGGPGGSPGGSNTQIQFNDSTAFGGDAGLTYDKTTDTLSVGNKVGVNVGSGFAFGTTSVGEFKGTANTFVQVIVQNANTGSNASSDFVLTADSGNNEIDFLDIGINSSTYSNATFSIGGAKDGYIYTSNSHLTIGTASAKEIIFHANGTTSANRKMTINATAITIANGVALSVNNDVGTVGEVLSSNGSAVYWISPIGSSYTTALGYNLP